MVNRKPCLEGKLKDQRWVSNFEGELACFLCPMAYLQLGPTEQVKSRNEVPVLGFFQNGNLVILPLKEAKAQSRPSLTLSTVDSTPSTERDCWMEQYLHREREID